MAINYAFRIAHEIYLFHPRARGDLIQSLLSPEAFLMMLFGTPLLLLGIAIRKEGLLLIRDWLAKVWGGLKHVLLDWRGYAAGILGLSILLLVDAMWRGYLIRDVLTSAREKFGGFLHHHAYVLGLSVAVYVLWLVTYLLARGEIRKVSDAVFAWFGGGFFIVTVQVLAILLYALGVAKYTSQDPTQKIMLWAGYLKDTIIYSVIAFFVGGGLVKFEMTVPRLRHSAWQALRWMAVGALVTALAALGGDVVFAGQVVLSRWGFDRVWPEEWQRRAVHLFVYVRDFAMLVPGIVVVFAWVTLRVSQIIEAEDERESAEKREVVKEHKLGGPRSRRSATKKSPKPRKTKNSPP
jgi:hypothetical protein